LSYDGITMTAVCHELTMKLDGTRIERINQPGTRDIILQLRNRENTFNLFCSADSRYPRVHLTSQKYGNPAVAPSFCMLLRKHLNGARLLYVEQKGLERIISFTFRGLDELGFETKKTLICEIMGKHSNLILTMPGENGPYILGAIKTVTADMSRHRAVMPGEPYILPPTQNKLDLFAVDEESLAEQMAGLADLQPRQFLMQTVMGVGPETADELISRASGPDLSHPLEMTRALTVELRQLAETLQNKAYTPCIVHLPGSLPRFSPILLTHLPQEFVSRCSSVNSCLDTYFTELLHNRREKEQKQQLTQAATAAQLRIEKKQRLQMQEFQEMEDADRYRIWAEMLTASLHMLRTGMKEAVVLNYYSDNQDSIRIPLNPAYPPQENAQRYFKKYRKLKDGMTILSRRLSETSQELDYLESLHTSLVHADLESLTEIREEMEQAGLIRAARTVKKPTETISTPLHFVSVDGIDIYVGKNNRQNDRLTLREASPDDIWLHTKDIPGAHVIIKNPAPPESTLLEAAKLAARYSKASASQNVPVDYTKVRHVRKPKGAKPGMVIYTHHHTLFVTP
jgi:predicted ribosome quality control (RQC) complex YloA/Tae2 family protein